MLNPIKTTDFDAIKLKLASPKNIRYKGIICDKCGVEVTRSAVRRERMGHIQLQTPCTHIWFLRGLSSKIGLILGLSMQALEKVVYFANFIITDVNEEYKNSTVEQIKSEFKQKKKIIENEFIRQTKEIKNKKAKLLQNGKKESEAQTEILKEIDVLEKLKEEKLVNLSGALDQAQKELKDLKPMAIISESVYQNLSLKYGHVFEASIGAEALRGLLERIDLGKTAKKLEKELEEVIDTKKEKIIRRLKLIKSLKQNNIRPEWMVLSVIPVIPPDLRPMVALDVGRFATSDLNDLYRRVINRNNRLKQLIKLNAPEVICRNEKRMLQEAVDALIDNSARQGRFRQNLLGKRIDYSGRSVIVVNPNLRLDQCGLPKKMALELFKPFIISKLIKKEIVHNVRSASKFIDTGVDEVWDILEDIIKGSYVMLNRAPTLHRLGIQSFKPVLIEGKAIQIHPMVCSAFNADFDGDQMAVHVPLTKEAIKESSEIMLSTKNLLKPATGDPVVAPSQDIVWGVFYITTVLKKAKEENIKYFSNTDEAKLAYYTKNIKLHEIIKVRIEKEGLIETTVGRVIFNDILPEKLRYINEVVGKKRVVGLVKECFRYYGAERTVELLDELKEKSFKFITQSGLSWGMGDLPKFEEKDILISETQEIVDNIQEQFDDGLLTESERYAKVIESWTSAKEKVTDICKTGLSSDGPVYSMIESGARGSWAQLTQILGMKGLVTSPSGDIIELPVKGNFKRGFGVLEYFISTHGVRKGLSDTALRTANAGYLTRRLVDVSQDVIIADEDCGDEEGFIMTQKESKDMGIDLTLRILGRYLAKDLKNEAGKVLVKKGELITEDILDNISKEKITEACIRSVLSCKLDRGVCVKCYGWDLGKNKPASIGVAVGTIAAQSIGEPGTQLTMRTFHTGGIAGVDDITQGLPRVEEIFEARSPKRKAFLADVNGRVKIESGERIIEDKNGRTIIQNSHSKYLKIYYEGTTTDKYNFNEIFKEINLKQKGNDEKKKVQAARGGTVSVDAKTIKIKVNTEKIKEFIVPKGVAILVNEGDMVQKGDQLTDGSLDLKQLFSLKGILGTQKYIIKEIQNVYSSQGQPLNDEHIENSVLQRSNKALEKGKKEAKTEQLLLGITKASLTTDSFLSAASFQETARVLIEAAINGKIDYLEGLKENVIIGRLIPAGTGYKGKQKRDDYSDRK